jgi:hypothetical protein
MDAARLPEVFDFEGLTVRCFSAARATEFLHLPHAERRAIPAIVRRVYAAAAKHAKEDADCLICGAPAPAEGGGSFIAVETDGNQDLGCVCSGCFGLSAPIARAT